MFADGSKRNAEIIAQRQGGSLDVSALIKRCAMNTKHVRPVHFADDEAANAFGRTS